MKVAFLIDGFNFYHSIRHLDPKFHWLNYYLFCCHFVPSSDQVEKVIFFTAKAHWLGQETVKRHSVFIEACKYNNIEIIEGAFKEKISYCALCKKSSIHHEEKYTDVNIALTGYRLACNTDIDKIIFVTGDTDLVPAINAIKSDFSEKTVGVLFPYKKHNHELKKSANFSFNTKIDTLEKYVMPKVLVNNKDKRIICPDKWIK